MTNDGKRVCNSFFGTGELHAANPRRFFSALAVVAVVVIEDSLEVRIGRPTAYDGWFVRPAVIVVCGGEIFLVGLSGVQPRNRSEQLPGWMVSVLDGEGLELLVRNCRVTFDMGEVGPLGSVGRMAMLLTV